MRWFKHISILLIFGVSSIVNAQFSPQQQQQLDSLNVILDNPASHDTSIVQAYVGLSEILYISNLDTLGFLCEKAKTIAEPILATNPPNQIQKALNTSLAGALNNIGYVHKQQGDIPLALEYYHNSLKIQEEINNKKGMAGSYNNIGYIHYNQSDIPLALEYYQKSLKILEEINYKQGMATSYNNIGMIHYEQGDIPLALEYYHKSLMIQEEINNKQGMATSYNNIGGIHYDQGEIPLALEYFHKSLKIYEEIGNKKGIAMAYTNFGGSLCSLDSLREGFEYLNKALLIFKLIDNKIWQAYTYQKLGHWQYITGNTIDASKNNLKALKIAHEPCPISFQYLLI